MGQDKNEQEEYIQQVTQQNTTLITMIQEQQKKIEGLTTTSKNLINNVTAVPQSQKAMAIKQEKSLTDNGRKRSGAIIAKAGCT